MTANLLSLWDSLRLVVLPAVSLLFIWLYATGPFLLLAVVARSLLFEEPLPRWLLAIVVLSTAVVWLLVWYGGGDPYLTGPKAAWQLAGTAGAILLPVAAAREMVKRGRMNHTDLR